MAFFIPVIPLLKILALGSIKVVLLFIGACFVPRFTLRLVLGGGVGMVLPVLDWLHEAGRMNKSDHDVLMHHLKDIEKESFTRKEARSLLFAMVKKTLKSMKTSLQQAPKNMLRWTTGWLKK